MKKKSKGKNKSIAVWKKMLYLLTVVGLGFFFFTGVAYAASDEEIISVLSDNKDLFVMNDLFTSGVRNMGWGIIMLLVKLADAAEGLFDTAFGFVDFTQYEPVQNFITSFKPVFIALLCLSLAFLGMTLMLHHEKKPKLVINICIAIVVVTSSTYIIGEMNQWISSGVRSEIISGTDTDQNSACQIVSDSIYDLLYLDTNIGLMEVRPDNRWFRDLDSDQLAMLNINELIKPDDVSDASKDLVGKYLCVLGDGIYVLDDIYDGVAWTDLLNTYYYRYEIEWFQCILGLLSLVIIYFCLAYKTVRILYEIVIHQLMAYLYSANLTDNQKVVKILNSLKDSYITLLLVVICMKIYLLAYGFINGLGLGGFTKAIMLVFVALAVIDGPNIIQKITGIDAGMTDGTHKLIAAFSGARMAAGALKPAGKLGSAAGKKVLAAHEKNKEFMDNQLTEALKQDTAASNLSSDAKENAGTAMPGSVSNSSENSEINNGNTDAHNTKNSADTLNEGGSDLQAGDISSENNVNGATVSSENNVNGAPGGNELNTTDVSNENNVNGAPGGEELNATDISSESNINGATVSSENNVNGAPGGNELNATEVSSEDNVNGATGGNELNATEVSSEGGSTVTNDSSQLDLSSDESIPESSGFSEGEADPQNFEGAAPTESAYDGMNQKPEIDPLTGESNGSNDFARMEEELSQDGLMHDSGLQNSEAVTYGGSMMQGMNGLEGNGSQKELGRDVEGQTNQSLSNISGNSTNDLGHGQLESNHVGNNLVRNNQVSRGTTGSAHISPGPARNESVSSGSATKASAHTAKGHGDLDDKVNLENL